MKKNGKKVKKAPVKKEPVKKVKTETKKSQLPSPKGLGLRTAKRD